MLRVIRLGLVTGLFLAVIVVGLIFARSHRLDIKDCQDFYTETVKRHDIVDTATNSLAAVDDAAVQVLHYVLTGETVYREAYTKDIETFETESGTLDIVTANNKAEAIVQPFLKSGPRVMEELAAVVALYEKTGQQAAVERIRKSSSVTYLNQARAGVEEIKAANGEGNDGSARLILRVLTSLHHHVLGAEAFAGLAMAAIGLHIIATRLQKSREA